MIDAIINAFFYVKKENKPITYLCDRQLSKEFNHIKKARQNACNVGGVKTELSEYFIDNLGLNTLERASAQRLVVSVRNQR
ncbi:MAG: hypothetical protein J6U92_02180 [Clostridia bacterium]|nr:hypothetical protein [Clostridia bacterium]